MNRPKIAIIGAGAVGSTTAYAILLRKLPADVMLIDIDEVRCAGEIQDLSDTLAFCEAGQIQAGTIKKAAQADIIIIAAGARQKINESRMVLFEKNKAIMQSIFDQLRPLNQNTSIIIVTNPVDLMTYYAQTYSGLPHEQVFGSGTFLDTQRMRLLLSEKLKIAQQSIHAYILGEHGETQFPAWSSAYVAGIPLKHFPSLDKKTLETIARQSKEKAYEIIKCKGATYYGIAMCVTAICRTIIYNEKRVTPLSVYSKKLDVCLSLPTVLGKKGIQQVLEIPLNDEEEKNLFHSAQSLKQFIK